MSTGVAELREMRGTAVAYAFIYDAIRGARVDGFYADEREPQ